MHPNDYDFDDLIERLTQGLSSELHISEPTRTLYDRSYPITTICETGFEKYFGDIEVDVRITIVIQSAYFEGATLDYYIEIYDCNYIDVDNDANDILDELFEVNSKEAYASSMNKGMRRIQAENAKNWYDQNITDTISKIEKVFEQVSEHELKCAVRFSNGEALYI